MLTKICERCDHEMKLIPAGISKKSRKPYSAFWSCDARSGGCGATASADGEAASAIAATSGASQERLASIERKLDEIISLIKGE